MKDTNVRDSFDLSKTLLPSDTKKSGLIDIDNFHLKLNKGSRFENDKFSFFRTGRKKGDPSYTLKTDFSHACVQEISKKMEDAVTSMGKIGCTIKSFDMKTDWRLAVGLGNESVYETSMTLHHIYGIPYIPGSAIKGATRNWVIMKFYKQIEEKALLDKGFCNIFGSPKEGITGEHKGGIIFFDSFPINIPTVEPDIINSHYNPYYTDNKPPADYYDPNINFFLTVTNTSFKFFIGVKNMDNRNISDGKFKDKNILSATEELVRNMLLEHGLGAKTAVGYGYFEEVKKI